MTHKAEDTHSLLLRAGRLPRADRMQLLADLISRAPSAAAELLAERAEYLADSPAPAPGRERIEERQTARGSYCLELVKCGKCKRCSGGPVHGPYWYWYGRRPDGRVYSRYIGKELRTIEEADAAREARRQAREDARHGAREGAPEASSEN